MQDISAEGFFQKFLAKACVTSIEVDILSADSEIAGIVFLKGETEYEPYDDTSIYGNGDLREKKGSFVNQDKIPEPLRHLLDHEDDRYYMDIVGLDEISPKDDNILRVVLDTLRGRQFLFVWYAGIHMMDTLSYIEAIIDRYDWELFLYNPMWAILDEDGIRSYPESPVFFYKQKIITQIPGLRN